MNRREFLATSAAAAGAALTRAEDRAVFPVVDTHQHLWDLGKFRLPWLADNPSLKRDYLMKDYLAATADLGKVGDLPAKVTKTVYMEVDVDPEQQTAEADYVIDICKRGDTPMKAAVISGRPASDGFKAYISRYKDSPYIKGVRQVLHGKGTPAGYCLDKQFMKGVQLLGELGMSFDICIRPGELEDAAKLIRDCPDTRFILDHCGNANVQEKDRSKWKEGLFKVAVRSNVVCKVSGIVASAAPGKWKPDDLAPIVNHVRESFGYGRVMFGGDWPVCTLAATYKQWFEALATIVRSWPAEEQRKLFCDNAVKFYGLK